MHRFEAYTIPKLFSKIILDKNECSLYKACQYECINAVGSYKCTCPPGYELQPSGKCKGKNYFESKFSEFHHLKNFQFYVLDIDECETGNHACPSNEECHNTGGSYKCVNLGCPSGYKQISTRTADR